MLQSKSIAKLNTALAGVQAKFGKLEKRYDRAGR